MTDMKPCDDSTYARVVARQPAMAGELIVVTSTRIVCRVGCTARTPLQANVRLVSSLDEAVAAGFRPCKRCRPDRFGPMPDAQAQAKLVSDFVKLADDPDVVATGVGGLARRLHISERQLRRIVRDAFGVTPSQFLRNHQQEHVA